MGVCCETVEQKPIQSLRRRSTKGNSPQLRTRSLVSDHSKPKTAPK